jgi:predicted transcriptional regulator
MLKSMGSRRHRLDIYYDILIATRSGSLKTHIAGDAKLNLGLLRQYLNYLVSLGLVTERKDIWKSRILYITSDKGNEYVEHYDALESLITKNP